MDKDRKDLEKLVAVQKEQLTRYETRLKDVVTAYKGLLREKEALEASLTALSSTDKTKSEVKDVFKGSLGKNSMSDDNSTNLQLQITTLMNSLATLSAEKSRMETSFQADKKQLRNDITQKDKIIHELHEKIKEVAQQNEIEKENMKSKIIIERHEREKESANHMVMIRELQKLYADERHLKENLEMQLNDLRIQFSSIDNSNTRIKELIVELKETKEKLKQYENQTNESPQGNSSLLIQLQNEMQNLKQQHSIAIKNEQRRAFLAEERNKKQAALHEERVANLEARLAELSSIVGTYDRLRQQSQENIQKLEEELHQLACGETETQVKQKSNKDIKSIVDEIMQLKKILLVENAKSDNPIDINKLFSSGADHNQCLEDITKLQHELENMKTENIELKHIVDVQKSHIKTLQEKVKVLNRNIDEQETELKAQSEKQYQAVKAEKIKWKELLTSLENEYRSKLNDLEQQLQNQRVRSLQLLDEKENEIKALKTSFEIFVPQNLQKDDNKRKDEPNNSNSNIPISSENCHMLHYANELARKDVEISNLRKAKYSVETALRQTLMDKVNVQEELNEKILRLEENVDRLNRSKTREGANLEYLKNVILSFLSTKDIEGKKHMINAIGTILQFTPNEMKAINTTF